jgi:competence protein ComFC
MIVDFLLDLIFPKICLGCDQYSSSYICAQCLKKIKFAEIPKCPICEKPTRFGESHLKCKGRLGIDGMTVGVDYSAETVKKIIHKFKYGGITNAAKELVEKFLKLYTSRDRSRPVPTIITFVPMYPDKERKRGYNQSEILAKEIGKILNLPVVKLLNRTKYTVSQMSVKKMEERMKNVEGIFEYVGAEHVLPRGAHSCVPLQKIILVDDVATTGATLFEATKVLKEKGVKSVWGMVLARRQ